MEMHHIGQRCLGSEFSSAADHCFSQSLFGRDGDPALFVRHVIEDMLSLVRDILNVRTANINLHLEDGVVLAVFDGQHLHYDDDADWAGLPQGFNINFPVVLSSEGGDRMLLDMLGVPDGIGSCVVCPLVGDSGQVAGAITAFDERARRFNRRQLSSVHALATLLRHSIRLHYAASHDYLTGLLTRRAFTRSLELESYRCRRYQRTSCLVLFDVDHFKAVNDTYGHVAGDVVLRDLAAMCRKLLRPVDLISRIGGEEFAAILPETNYSSGLACSERLRCEIAAMRFPDFPTLAVTASFGISSSEMGTAESWMSSADECLYAAKRSGRNRCVVSALERLAS